MRDFWSRLSISFDEPVRDPLWRNVMLPSEFARILSNPAFVKLSRILQLGPAHLVYPGATHTRLAHSIGVYEMARRTLGALGQRHDLDWIDAEEARGFLVAALCHDVGHFPYAHSLKELPLREHESLTADALRGPLRVAVLAAGANPEFAAAVVDEAADDPPPRSRKALELFRSLLSGVLDPDKLDYLNRDARSCGVPYGLQDVDFALQHLGLGDDGSIGIAERGAMAVESVLFSKYQMYRAVYWHKSVRSATSMIKRAVLDDLGRGALRQEQLYGLDDPGFYSLMSEGGRDRFGLIGAVYHGRLLPMVASYRFDQNNETHRLAADLETRRALESALGAPPPGTLPPELSVVVDVPEPISFESDLQVIGTGMRFSSWSTAFGPEVVSSFAGSLRILRVYAPPESAARVAAAADAMFGPGH